MFAAPIILAEKYDYLAPKFKAAYAFLQRTDLAQLEVGAYPVAEGVVANVQHYTTILSSTALFETHDTHFDVQYMIEGCEQFGIVNRNGLCVNTPYDNTADITFYEEPEQSGTILLTPGDFVIVSPDDAHKPRCIATQAQNVKKIVVKIEV